MTLVCVGVNVGDDGGAGVAEDVEICRAVDVIGRDAREQAENERPWDSKSWKEGSRLARDFAGTVPKDKPVEGHG